MLPTRTFSLLRGRGIGAGDKASRLHLYLVVVTLLSGCSLIAPFNSRTRDAGVDAQPDGEILPDADDNDDQDDGGDGDDVELDTYDSDVDDEEECAPACDDRSCGPDGCGGQCGGDCGSGLVCATSDSSRNAPRRCTPHGAGLWIVVEAGSFIMGSASEPGRDDLSETQHPVELTTDLLVLSTEVSQELYTAVIGSNPSFNQGENLPVENVMWSDAAGFCNALSVNGGFDECYSCVDDECTWHSEMWDAPRDCQGYRLPTDAEWEFLARAGTTTTTYNGDFISDEYIDNYGVLNPIACHAGHSAPCLVADFEPNSWGLFDMIGNVHEWCDDWFLADLRSGPAEDPWQNIPAFGRVRRGGGWHDGETLRIWHHRSAARSERSMNHASDNVGLRPVRSLIVR